LKQSFFHALTGAIYCLTICIPAHSADADTDADIAAPVRANLSGMGGRTAAMLLVASTLTLRGGVAVNSSFSDGKVVFKLNGNVNVIMCPTVVPITPVTIGSRDREMAAHSQYLVELSKHLQGTGSLTLETITASEDRCTTIQLFPDKPAATHITVRPGRKLARKVSSSAAMRKLDADNEKLNKVVANLAELIEIPNIGLPGREHVTFKFSDTQGDSGTKLFYAFNLLAPVEDLNSSVCEDIHETDSTATLRSFAGMITRYRAVIQKAQLNFVIQDQDRTVLRVSASVGSPQKLKAKPALAVSR
jgi:hypothetical protein